MIELEIYAPGVRSLERVLELDHELEALPGLRYKVDPNHDIVYLEFDEPTFTIHEIRGIFRKLGLEARIVGSIPTELNPKNKTQQIGSMEFSGLNRFFQKESRRRRSPGLRRRGAGIK